jgi:1,4-dihydroxy-2-naphthoate polyprenyltransferase
MKNIPAMPSLVQIRAFARLSRFKFLAGGVLAFGLGAAIARFDGAQIDVRAYIYGQVMVSSFHLMVHYANDYFDRFCDAAAERTPWSGGSGALVEGELSPTVALLAAFCCGAIGIVMIATFALKGNVATAVIGVAIALLAWSYSAPPLRFLARGWGELDTAVIIGLLFPLAGYVTFAHDVSPRFLVSILPSFAAMFVLMFCVEFPDVEADRRTGKLNLVARCGRIRARTLVYTAVASIYVAAAAALLFGATPFLAAFSALALPIAWKLVRQLARADLTASPVNAEIAGRGVALFVVTVLGSVLAYVAVTT